MDIVREEPPNYEEICKVFPIVRNHKGTVFAWGDKIYAPHLPEDETLTPGVIAHELTHQRQQTEYGGPEAWWRDYLADIGFMLDQEVEAYRAQLQFMKTQYPDLPLKAFNKLVFNLASDLSGPMYGNIVSYGAAEIMIKRKYE